MPCSSSITDTCDPSQLHPEDTALALKQCMCVYIHPDVSAATETEHQTRLRVNFSLQHLE